MGSVRQFVSFLLLEMFHGYSLDLGQMAQVPGGLTPLPLILTRLVKQTSR